jgi:small subunit ribosomal protein S8
MNISDPIGDLITRIRNGYSSGAVQIKSPSSKARCSLLDVLAREGYIRSFSEETLRPGIKEVVVQLKYFEGQPSMKEIHRVSKPGLKIYVEASAIKPYYNGLGVSILSTSKGLMTDSEAKAAGIGGEILCKVF